MANQAKAASGPSIDLNAAIRTVLSPSFDILGGLAGELSSVALASISSIGIIGVDQMVTSFSALARTDSAAVPLDHERVRHAIRRTQNG